MRYIPKPGQSAPQMTPRGPRGPIKNLGGVRAVGGMNTPQRQVRQSLMEGAMSGAKGKLQRAQGLAATMNGQRSTATPQRTQGLGTGMGTGMNKMAGAGAALGKAFGAKKGGKVSSKMGKVKTGSGRDGVAERGHTKGMMPKMTKRG